jgi:RNA polymerase sigma-70 factor (ECF subfamily)
MNAAAHAAEPRPALAAPFPRPRPAEAETEVGPETWRSVLQSSPDELEPDLRARAAALYRRYGPAVYRRCLRLLREPEAARDATQEVFLKLVANLDRVPPDVPVLAWLYRVASNHCLNLRRAGRHRGDGLPEGDLETLAAAPGPDLPDLALARQVLSRFDEVTRLVAVGILVDGMEHEELALVLGISRRSVARKLERFLEGARRFLALGRAGDAGGADLAC